MLDRLTELLPERTPVSEACGADPLGTVRTRLTDELELDADIEREGLEEWRRDRAVAPLDAGEVSFTRAAFRRR